MNSFWWLVPGTLVMHSCFTSCDHLPGFPCQREGTEGQTLDTMGCGFPLRRGYTGSQALVRWIPLPGKTGNKFHDQGSGGPFALTLMGLEGRGAGKPLGHPGPLPAFYIVIPPAMTSRAWINEAPVPLLWRPVLLEWGWRRTPLWDQEGLLGFPPFYG